MRWGALGLRCGRYGELSWVQLGYVLVRWGMAGEVLFGEQRFVRAGLIGVSFGWVWYVRAGMAGSVKLCSGDVW